MHESIFGSIKKQKNIYLAPIMEKIDPCFGRRGESKHKIPITCKRFYDISGNYKEIFAGANNNINECRWAPNVWHRKGL